jgi:PAS domain S-box-containing protein
VALVAAAGTTINTLVYRYESGQARSADQANFERDANAYAERAQDRVRGVEQALRALTAVFGAAAPASLAEFERAAAELITNRPESEIRIKSLGLVRATTREQATAFVVDTRLAGQPQFAIVPETGDDDLRIAQYVWPPGEPFIQPGFALQRNAQIRAALDEANSGEPVAVATGDGADSRVFIYIKKIDVPRGEAPRWVFVAFAEADAMTALSNGAQGTLLASLEPSGAEGPDWFSTGRNVRVAERTLRIGPLPWTLWICGESPEGADPRALAKFVAGMAVTAAAASIVALVRLRCEIARRRADAAAEAARSAAQHKRALALVATASEHGMLILDASGTVQWVNEEYARLAGREVKDLIGSNPSADLYGSATSPEAVEEMRRRMADGTGFRVEMTIAGASGTERWVENEVRPVRDEAGAIANFVVVQRDITDRVKASAELVTARDAALRMAERKSQFLENMTDELRPHLAAVVEQSRKLLESQLTKEQKDSARAVRTGIDAVAKVLEGVNDLSKLEGGKLDLENVDFHPRELAEDMAELYSAEAAVRGLELICDVGQDVPAVSGDPARVRQLLAHLIENAINFTDAGEITVQVRCVLPGAPGEVKLAFSVADTGIGMSAADPRALLEPFARGSNAEGRPARGSGLGLAVTNQIVRRMGGTLQIESEPGRGSRVRFEVPLRPAASDVPDSGGAEFALALRGKRILVADDHPDARASVVAALSACGAEITDVAGGEPAIAAVFTPSERGPFDLVIVDQRMPGVDGVAVARAMREVARDLVTPILLLKLPGAVLEPGDADMLGCHAELTKPARRATLLGLAAAGVRGEWLPASSTRDPGAKAEPAAPSEPLALIVDDDTICQKVAQSLLRKLGWRFETVRNGAEAVERFAKQPFDVVLMDCQMPEMDGFEATGVLRTLEAEGRRTPIVAMTANTGLAEREKCIEAGMDDFLSKPVRIEELRSKLLHWHRPAPVEAIPAPVDNAMDMEAMIRPILHRLSALGILDQPAACETKINAFADAATAMLGAAREALMSGSLGGSVELARRLVRSSMHVGAEPITETADRVARCIQNGDAQGAGPLLDTLEKQLSGVRKFAREIIKDAEFLQRHAELAGVATRGGGEP